MEGISAPSLWGVLIEVSSAHGGLGAEANKAHWRTLRSALAEQLSGSACVTAPDMVVGPAGVGGAT